MFREYMKNTEELSDASKKADGDQRGANDVKFFRFAFFFFLQRVLFENAVICCSYSNPNKFSEFFFFHGLFICEKCRLLLSRTWILIRTQWIAAVSINMLMPPNACGSKCYMLCDLFKNHEFAAIKSFDNYLNNNLSWTSS